MSIGTLILILEVLGVLGVATLIFITGHRMGRWSCRHDYANGFDKGWQGGEDEARAAWEEATGQTLDQFTAWHRPPEPGLEGGWQEPPATEVLRAEYVRQGYTEPSPVPSTSDMDWLAAQYEAKHAPVVANVTDAARWRAPSEDDVPTIAGVVVTQPPAPPPGDWDLLAGSVLPDYAAAALGGHRTVDECVDSIVMRAVKP